MLPARYRRRRKRRLRGVGKDGWVRSSRDNLALFCIGLMAYMSIAMSVVCIVIDMPEGILFTHIMFPPILVFAYLVVRRDRDRTWAMVGGWYGRVEMDVPRAIGSALSGEGYDVERLGRVQMRQYPDHFYDGVFVLEDEGLEVIVIQQDDTAVYIGPVTLGNRKEIGRLKALVDKVLGEPITLSLEGVS